MELTGSEGKMVLTGDYETVRLGVGEVNVDPVMQRFSWTVGSKQLMTVVTFLIKHLKTCVPMCCNQRMVGMPPVL